MTLIIIKTKWSLEDIRNQFSFSKQTKECMIHPAFPIGTSKNFQELKWKMKQSIS